MVSSTLQKAGGCIAVKDHRNYSYVHIQNYVAATYSLNLYVHMWLVCGYRFVQQTHYCVSPVLGHIWSFLERSPSCLQHYINAQYQTVSL